MRYFITGGVGMVGSALVNRLFKQDPDCHITVYDNLSNGKIENLKKHLDNYRLVIHEADLNSFKFLKKAMAGSDIVFHFAANSDIKNTGYTDIDLNNGVLGTYNVLEAMRLNKIKKIVFSSSSVVYGDNPLMPTPEDYGPLMPISLYGASKLACEGYISAFSHNFDIQAWIFRFANVVGPNLTHGVIYDFMKKLGKNPDELEVLGDGKQEKSFIDIDDLLSGILHTLVNTEGGFYNIGTDDTLSIEELANMVATAVPFQVLLKFMGGTRGWKGDVTKMLLDTKKIKALGWEAKLNSKQACVKAIVGAIK